MWGWKAECGIWSRGCQLSTKRLGLFSKFLLGCMEGSLASLHIPPTPSRADCPSTFLTPALSLTVENILGRTRMKPHDSGQAAAASPSPNGGFIDDCKAVWEILSYYQLQYPHSVFFTICSIFFSLLFG